MAEKRVESVDRWLEFIGMGEYSSLFAENKIDPDVLLELTDADLRELGLPLGPRKKLLREIRNLATVDFDPVQAHLAAGRSRSPRRAPSRRYLTVAFIDLVDFTVLTGQLDPEELVALMTTFQRTCAQTATRYGGHVAKALGDGIVVYFGWPEAHEGDPERAVLAALDMVENVKSIPVETTGWLNVHIGIATGEVVVGDVTDLADVPAHDVFGNAPNLAARLQALAGPGETFICPRTQSLVRHKIQCHGLGEHALKGFDRPVSVWRAEKPLAARATFDERRAAGLSPFVGRTLELSKLKQLMARAQAGDGQFVLLTGEPGIGKSRAASELAASLADSTCRCHLLQCAQLHSDTPLHPVAAWLESEVRGEVGDRVDLQIERLAALLAEPDEPDGEIRSTAAILLNSDKLVRYAPFSISHEAHRTRILNLLNRYVCRMAAASPVLLVVEDIHWSDPTTLSWLEQLAGKCRDTALMVLATSRPGPHLGHPGLAQATVLQIGRLDGAECTAIAGALNEDRSISPKTIAEIVRRSDGNPLFVEELTRALANSALPAKAFADNGLLDGPDASTVPPALRASLMSRVDQQPADSRVLAELCAVIGKTFAFDVLAAASQVDPDTLRDTLEDLIQQGFLEVEHRHPDLVYTFRHALIHDTIYGSILISSRRNIHRKIARILESEFPRHCRNQPELLAYHFAQSGNAQAAFAYYLKAAHLATDHSALPEAQAYLKRGEELLPLLPPSQRRDELELELRSLLASCLIFSIGWAAPEVKAAFGRALVLCQALGKRRSLIPIQWGLATHNLLIGDIAAATTAGEKVLEIAEELGDPEHLTVAHSALAIYSFYGGAFDAAVGHWDKTRGLSSAVRAEPFRTQFGTDRYLQALRGACLANLCLGHHRLALEMEEEQRATAERQGFAFERAYALGISCIFHGLRRDAPAIRRHAAAGLEIAAAAGFNFMRVSMEKYQCLGEALQAPSEGLLQSCEQALQAYTDTGTRMGQSSYLSSLAELYSALGDVEKGLGAVARGLAYVERSGERYAASLLLRVQADLVAASGRRDEAERLAEQAIEVARQQNAKTWELEASVALATCFVEEGNSGDVRRLLEPLCDWFEDEPPFPASIRARALLEARI